jgi:hypothetical protein
MSVKLVIKKRAYLLGEGAFDWMSVSTYSRIRGLKISQVNNWIRRGVIPSDCQLYVPELNRVLINNRVYKPKPTGRPVKSKWR